MTILSDLVGGLGAAMVTGRVQVDRVSTEVARVYQDEPLLNQARIPRMVLSEVTVEVRFATGLLSDGRIEVLVTTDELAKIKPECVSTLVVKFTEDDLEQLARTS
jgi:hypothetical protein